MNRLLQQHGGLAPLFSGQAKALGLAPETLRWLENPDQDLLAADLEWLSRPNHHLLTWGDDDYPELLRRSPAPPAALWVAGDPGALWQPQLAIVGSRNPTSGGLANARAFAAHLARGGLALTSGLAEGIDSAVHQATIDAGGCTVAVLGTGVDQVYPAHNARLHQDIVQHGGALVSEFPLGTTALASHFPSRNRIIAGLSLGTLVVEAGTRSGSLITARLAGEAGREIFAIPGSIHNPMARGCHKLLRNGARLVETADDILQELQPLAEQLASTIRERLELPAVQNHVEISSNKPNIALDPEYRQLWSSLSFDPMHMDQITEQSGMETREVSSMLLMLELRGMVESHPGGGFSRKQ